MFVGQSVRTPYGVGVVKSVRQEDEIFIVQPTTWALATGKPPIFYMNPNDVNPIYPIGSQVSTSFGAGKIVDIRSDGVYVVTLLHWALATGKSPILYLQESSITEPSKAPVIENISEAPKKIDYVTECVLRAKGFKDKASIEYSDKFFEKARLSYMEAVSQLRFLGDDLSDELKASVLEQIIPCYNNVALCSYNTKQYADCVANASQALKVIESLEEKIQKGSKVWNALLAAGVTAEKFLDWKKKAVSLIGRASYSHKEYESSITYLQEAIKLTGTDPSKGKELTMLKDFLAKAKAASVKETKKAKARWSKAFQENNNVMEAEEKAAAQAKEAVTIAPGSKGKTGKADLKDIKVDMNKLGIENSSSSNEKNQVALPTDFYSSWVFGAWFASLAILSGLGFYWSRLRKYR